MKKKPTRKAALQKMVMRKKTETAIRQEALKKEELLKKKAKPITVTELVVSGPKAKSYNGSKVIPNDMAFQDIVIPSGTTLPFQGRLPSLPTDISKPLVVNIGIVMTFIMKGIISEYIYNRGLKGFNKAAAESCRKNGYWSDTLGEFIIGEKFNKITMVGWHSRMHGLFRRYIDGNMTQSELESHIVISWTTNFDAAYQRSGERGTAHNFKQDSSNPDLIFGKAFSKLEKLLGPVVSDRIKYKLSTPLSAIFYAFHLENCGKDIKWTWDVLYKIRGKAARISKEYKEELCITDTQYKNLADAIIFWYYLVIEIQSCNISFIKKAGQESGLLGYVVCDRLSGRNFVSSNHKSTVKKMINRAKVTQRMPELCRTDAKEFIQELDALMKSRTPKIEI